MDIELYLDDPEWLEEITAMIEDCMQYNIGRPTTKEVVTEIVRSISPELHEVSTLVKRIGQFLIEGIYICDEAQNYLYFVSHLLEKYSFVFKKYIKCLLSVFPVEDEAIFVETEIMVNHYKKKMLYAKFGIDARKSFIYLMKKLTESEFIKSEREIFCFLTIFSMIFEDELHPALLYLALKVFDEFLKKHKLTHPGHTSMFERAMGSIREYFPLTRFYLPPSHITISQFDLGILLTEILGKYDFAFASEYEEPLLAHINSRNGVTRFCTVKLLYYFLLKNAEFSPKVLVEIHLELMNTGARKGLFDLTRPEKYYTKTCIKLIFIKLKPIYDEMDENHALLSGSRFADKTGYNLFDLLNFLISMDIGTKMSAKIFKYICKYLPKIFKTYNIPTLEYHIRDIQKPLKENERFPSDRLWILFLTALWSDLEFSLVDRIMDLSESMLLEKPVDDYMFNIMYVLSKNYFWVYDLTINNFEIPIFLSTSRFIASAFFYKAILLVLKQDCTNCMGCIKHTKSDVKLKASRLRTRKSNNDIILYSIDQILVICSEQYLAEYMIRQQSHTYRILAHLSTKNLTRFFEIWLNMVQASDPNMVGMRYCGTATLFCRMISFNLRAAKCIDKINIDTKIWRYLKFFLNYYCLFLQKKPFDRREDFINMLNNDVKFEEYDFVRWSFHKGSFKNIKFTGLFIEALGEFVYDIIEGGNITTPFISVAILTYSLGNKVVYTEEEEDLLCLFVLKSVKACHTDSTEVAKGLLKLLRKNSWLVAPMKKHMSDILEDFFNNFERCVEPMDFSGKKFYLDSLVFCIHNEILSTEVLSMRSKMLLKLTQDRKRVIRLLAVCCRNKISV